MSVSKYRYTESCDGQPCPWDCDLCGKEDDMDDLISRQAAIDALDAIHYTDREDQWTVLSTVENLPSAQPDLSGYSDKLWKAAYERGKREGRKTGKWIHKGCACFECNQCGERVTLNVYTTEKTNERFKFCPNCGADMRGEEDG